MLLSKKHVKYEQIKNPTVKEREKTVRERHIVIILLEEDKFAILIKHLKESKQACALGNEYSNRTHTWKIILQ